MSNKNIYLAPMVGRTDEYYRSFIRILSNKIRLYTEMITCDAFLHTNKSSYKVKPQEKHLTIQLAGADPKKYGLCSKIIEEQGYDEINLNIGCPSNKVIKGRFGACLMNSPSIVAECISEIKNSCSLPISIKTRLGLGYDENLDLLLKLIQETNNAGCYKYFIHARNAILDGLSPKNNRKIPALRYTDVNYVKKLYPNLEIYLNGGVDSIDCIKENLNKFEGLMIGRKIYDDPIFLFIIEKEIYKRREVLTRRTIIEQYIDYALSLPDNVSNYLLLRHLFSLYYNTNSSKKWKKFLHEVIQNNEDIRLVLNFNEVTYEEKQKTYG